MGAGQSAGEQDSDSPGEEGDEEDTGRRVSVLDFGEANSDFARALAATEQPRRDELGRSTFGQCVTAEQADSVMREWQANRRTWKYQAFVSRNIFSLVKPFVESSRDLASAVRVDEMRKEVCPLIASFLDFDPEAVPLDESENDRPDGNAQPSRGDGGGEDKKVGNPAGPGSRSVDVTAAAGGAAPAAAVLMRSPSQDSAQKPRRHTIELTALQRLSRFGTVHSTDKAVNRRLSHFFGTTVKKLNEGFALHELKIDEVTSGDELESGGESAHSLPAAAAEREAPESSDRDGGGGAALAAQPVAQADVPAAAAPAAPAQPERRGSAIGNWMRRLSLKWTKQPTDEAAAATGAASAPSSAPASSTSPVAQDKKQKPAPMKRSTTSRSSGSGGSGKLAPKRLSTERKPLAPTRDFAGRPLEKSRQERRENLIARQKQITATDASKKLAKEEAKQRKEAMKKVVEDQRNRIALATRNREILRKRVEMEKLMRALLEMPCVYTSNVTSDRTTQYQTRKLKWVLDSKQITYRMVDVSLDLDERDYMFEKSGVETLPQVFVNDTFRGCYEEMVMANDMGLLHEIIDPYPTSANKLLGPALAAAGITIDTPLDVLPERDTEKYRRFRKVALIPKDAYLVR